MAVVQLHGADVGLQSVHGLVLLLVQHPEEGGGDDLRGERKKGKWCRFKGSDDECKG